MTEGNFVDYVKIHVASGKGGSGSSHLHREKYIAKGGPDGGDGGRGGHVIVKGNKNLWTLYHLKFKRHIRAEHGGNGSKQRSSGAEGSDEYIEVPLGTVIRDTETQKVIHEITEDGKEYLVAEGGMGGRGNWHFKSSTNQTPRYSQPGIDGTEVDITLELKVLADVGLVGFPNAGKSTLLSVITAAKPKIADYEFTTLKPNLGIVEYRDFKTFVVADIPGIIEGAAEGRGIGHRFLRHIERNSTLLFLIPADAPNISEQYEILLDELRRYNPEMLDKDRLIAISKSDMLDAELKLEMKHELDKNLGAPYLFISSVAQQGLTELKDRLWEMLNKEPS
ncbi:GTPase ObgE [Salegentibacter mishustinae]|jgi:GTP-binding protein|uniref:GTPase Obg n=1 Tax=Salegentibacter mishustinae TaxID=270918 RepID=A0A0Q9Z6L7_9FLAO|nr:GTPase ObgE [Salegentibacter mishustinae]KRG28597.1 GTPase Obg [Salegentibacter mishustinae]PNW22529.1 GTPase Obg [Salegentibacter mishustinae]PZX67772.1 GTP-binding protein [Salegentibacter mishustinae]UBZ07623.1 GTPase ObgE [Salegentibacter mishustinae]GGW77482.1 GTPase Obg [Salegentibacter mishustinae]|tara:strand:+ start:1565 stop:2572 length:1008 start_codon:yes stop_codon:yes gene_type:complete